MSGKNMDDWITVELFALLHIPDYVFRLYSTVPMALSGVASEAMFGALMGYEPIGLAFCGHG